MWFIDVGNFSLNGVCGYVWEQGEHKGMLVLFPTVLMWSKSLGGGGSAHMIVSSFVVAGCSGWVYGAACIWKEKEQSAESIVAVFSQMNIICGIAEERHKSVKHNTAQSDYHNKFWRLRHAMPIALENYFNCTFEKRVATCSAQEIADRACLFTLVCI